VHFSVWDYRSPHDSIEDHIGPDNRIVSKPPGYYSPNKTGAALQSRIPERDGDHVPGIFGIVRQFVSDSDNPADIAAVNATLADLLDEFTDKPSTNRTKCRLSARSIALRLLNGETPLSIADHGEGYSRVWAIRRKLKRRLEQVFWL
jgi:hypothetical protein